MLISFSFCSSSALSGSTCLEMPNALRWMRFVVLTLSVLLQVLLRNGHHIKTCRCFTNNALGCRFVNKSAICKSVATCWIFISFFQSCSQKWCKRTQRIKLLYYLQRLYNVPSEVLYGCSNPIYLPLLPARSLVDNALYSASVLLRATSPLVICFCYKTWRYTAKINVDTDLKSAEKHPSNDLYNKF